MLNLIQAPAVTKEEAMLLSGAALLGLSTLTNAADVAHKTLTTLQILRAVYGDEVLKSLSKKMLTFHQAISTQ